MQKKRRRTHLRRKRIPTSILLRSKRRMCPFKEAGIDRLDYKDVELLKDYVTQGGKIIPSRISGVCTSNQRKLKIAVRRARNIALLSPMKGFVPQQFNTDRRFTVQTHALASSTREENDLPDNQENSETKA
mgnify:CR=1 FL=1